MSAYVVPTICAPISNQMIQFTQETYPHLHRLELADNSHGSEELSVNLLIGADSYWHFVTGETVRDVNPGPVAILTKLGYVLSGPVSVSIHEQHESTINLTETHVLKISSTAVDDRSLNSEIKQFWDLESLGIRPNEETVGEQFSRDVHFNGERYEVSLPLKENRELLPDNFQVSQSRLNSLPRHLKSKPEMLEHYNEVIQDQLDKNIIEVVDEEQPAPAVGKVHYLPHHEVVRLDKSTTKVRVVFDASCKRDEPCLNDCLYAGDVLLRFCAHRTAITADIEKGFLNVAVSKDHRDLLRFLWVDDIHKDHPQLVIRRYARIVFGVNSSPFLLNATIKHHMNSYRTVDPSFVEEVLRSLYVDGLASSKPDSESTYEFYIKLNERFYEGGFNMRKWKTNDQDLQRKMESQNACEKSISPAEIQSEDQSFSKSQFQPSTSQDIPKDVGIPWHNSTDQLEFTFEVSQLI